jgi:2-acylglycerol O-acyltransferase 2
MVSRKEKPKRQSSSDSWDDDTMKFLSPAKKTPQNDPLVAALQKALAIAEDSSSKTKADAKAARLLRQALSAQTGSAKWISDMKSKDDDGEQSWLNKAMAWDMQLAPLNIPLVRRRQTFAVIALLGGPFMSFWATVLLFWFGSPNWRALLLCYIGFLMVDKGDSTGGRAWMRVRSCKLFEWFRDFFPVTLIKTVDLDPNKKYIFGYHPHGIISIGAITNFGTDATEFSKKFPGINLRLLTLKMNFYLPFWRELLLLGICNASKQSCNNILKQGPGNALMLVLGGAAESLDAHPGTFDLTLANRKGFVKIGLTQGAALVPVFSFGEVDIYRQVPNAEGSPLRRFQNKLQKTLGFAVPLVIGRGVFSYGFGLLPQRKPIVSIVGVPIELPQVDSPSQEQIDFYHSQYMDGVKQIFDAHKQRYALNRQSSLRFK